MTAAEIAQHLKASKNGHGWIAFCPVHNDKKTPNLSIDEGADGRTLVHCHACAASLDQIAAASGLKMTDFFPPKSITSTPTKAPKAPATSLKEVASYTYVNEQGELRYRVVRYSPKKFKQCRPDPEHPGKVVWNLDGERRMLYHLDKIQGEKAVALVEGEKDADRLIAEGVLATTNSGGSGQWTADHAAQLKAAGIEAVYVLPDADAPGLKWLTDVEKTCAAVGVWVIDVNLPATDGLKPGWDVSDWLDAGNPIERLREMLEVAAYAVAHIVPAEHAKYLASLPQPPDPEPDFDVDVPAPLVKPRIVIDGTQSLDALADATWQVLLHANEPPVILRQGAELVRLVREKSGRASLRELKKARLKARLVRVADFRKSDAETAKAARVPDDLVEDMMVDDDRDVPLITRIVEAPVFLPDGRLLAERGHDAASGILYAPPQTFEVQPVSKVPTAEDVAKARDLLLEVFCDVPFCSDADKAAVLALLLSGFARELVPGNAPMVLIDKPTPRTGATLIVDAIGTIVDGRPLAKIPEAEHEAEWRKRLMAVALEAGTYVCVDNLRQKLDVSCLSAMLTASGQYSDRLLGHSKMASAAARSLWVVTANNATVSKEIAERIVWCRLDAKLEHPGDDRTTPYKHQRLLLWIEEQRAALVWSCLVLIQNWLALGRPASPTRMLGGFEGWCETLGGVLHAAGIHGLLENTQAFRERADADTAPIKAFLAAWWLAHREKAVPVRDLVPVAISADLDVEGKTDRATRTRLGMLLKREQDRRYTLDGMTVVISGAADQHDKVARWRLTVEVDPAGPL